MLKHSARTLALGILFAVLGGAVALHGSARVRADAPQANDPVAVWGSLDAAINRGDAAGAAALFSADAVYEQPGTVCASLCTGRSSIEVYLAQLVSQHLVCVTLPGSQVDPSEPMVTGRWQMTTDAGTVVVPFTFATVDNEIVALRVGAPFAQSLISAGGAGVIGATPASLARSGQLLGLSLMLGALALALLALSRSRWASSAGFTVRQRRLSETLLPSASRLVRRARSRPWHDR